jgi:dCMP deaminase
MSPCRECAKLIHQAGIARVVYRDAYKDESGLVFLNSAGVEVVAFPHALLYDDGGNAPG